MKRERTRRRKQNREVRRQERISNRKGEKLQDTFANLHMVIRLLDAHENVIYETQIGKEKIKAIW